MGVFVHAVDLARGVEASRVLTIHPVPSPSGGRRVRPFDDAGRIVPVFL